MEQGANKIMRSIMMALIALTTLAFVSAPAAIAAETAAPPAKQETHHKVKHHAKRHHVKKHHVKHHHAKKVEKKEDMKK